MTTYLIPDTIVIQDVVSESVLLDVEKGAYFELNEMGAEILRRLRLQNDSESVIESLLEDYDVTETTVRQDFQELLEQLEHHGLVKRQ